MKDFELSGQIVDLEARKIFPGKLAVISGRISSIQQIESAPSQHILPGLIDAHVHVESSMLAPSEFARLAVVHGTVATVSDPHEIGNVLGVDGVHYMLENAKLVPFKFFFGAPSCVPATTFETAGAEIDVKDIEALLDLNEVPYLSEMMNFPGVLNGDPTVLAKIQAAKLRGKPIDGHSPGLRGEQAKLYIEAGISSDHECFTAEEALDKLKWGMKIAIREGSAAKNFDALIDLLPDHPDMIMFCSDDKHPNDLVVGHIDELVKRGIARGVDPFLVLRAACVTPVEHYNLDVGQLREGDPADFIVVDDLKDFNVLENYINGKKVAERGNTLIEHREPAVVNKFDCKTIEAKDLCIEAKGEKLRSILALDGQLITKEEIVTAKVENGLALSDTSTDILKLAVVNRYQDAEIALAFVKGFGLKSGAVASSVAHDSHNIVAVGTNDHDLANAINLVIEAQGGVSLATEQEQGILPLPIAGLMAVGDGYKIASDYEALDQGAKKLGSTLPAPFMTLSFLALLVIPELKLSDKGLFDGRSFEFVPLFV